MNKLIITLVLSVFIIKNSNAQGITYNVDLNNPTSVTQNLKAMAKSETNFWATALSLDAELTKKLESNNFAIYNQYIHSMKYVNFTMEKILLVEQKNLKERRDRFMKMFLNKKKYKIFQEIVVNAGKKQIKKYKDNATEEMRKLRVEAAGWNVLNHRIFFK